MLAAVAGFCLLSLAGTFALACVAVVVIGCGFAPVYPIVAETLDERFSYQPGFYNGIFSLAITGAMSAPWLLGYVEALLGTRWIMLLPAAGSICSVVLALLIKLEAHVMGGSQPAGEPERAIGAAGGR
jgi:MFS family permease